MPLAACFMLGVWLRRTAYLHKWIASYQVGVPVFVVGNITAGGSGKTPMVIWLVNWLLEQGWYPGVISRGYGGNARGCVAVHAGSAASEVGDEPLLIHYKTQVPVVVGRDRVAAAQTLLKQHPHVNILVSDDGLQHYRLQRQLEIVVMDVSTGLGNGLAIPAGPLREPRSRLKTVDAVVCVNRSHATAPSLIQNCYQAAYTLGNAYALNARNQKIRLTDLPVSPWLAISGIGNPEGFFAMLTQLGWSFKRKIFPDHHPFTAADIPLHTRVVMTEKDAVKCAAFAQPDWWALELNVQPEAGFTAFLQSKISAIGHRRRTCQTDWRGQ